IEVPNGEAAGGVNLPCRDVGHWVGPASEEYVDVEGVFMGDCEVRDAVFVEVSGDCSLRTVSSREYVGRPEAGRETFGGSRCRRPGDRQSCAKQNSVEREVNPRLGLQSCSLAVA